MKTTLQAVALSTLTALASAQVPAGGQFQVNTYTTGLQYFFGRPLAIEADGDFVAVWQSFGQDGSAMGVFGQRFSASGARRGGEFAVNTYTTGLQYRPSVAGGRHGDFVVVWSHSPQTVPTGTIEGRRYDRNGVPIGSEFLISTQTTGFAATPKAAQASDGRFVAAWTAPDDPANELDIAARRFDAAGDGIGNEFLVNTERAERQWDPDVAIWQDGRFIVVWTDYNHPMSGRVVKGQRYSANGNALGSDFQVNTDPGDADQPAISGSADGSFVVSWVGNRGMAARLFDASGSPVGGEFAVTASTTAYESVSAAHVAIDDAGNFVVVWEGPGVAGNRDVFAHRFAADGTSRSGEFRVNSIITGYQRLPSVGSDAVGNFVVAWGSADGSNYGIFAQRFGGLGPAALAVGTAGNGVLEPGETVAVRPSWRNFNGAAQTFSGTLTDITGPAGATYAITDGAGDYGTVADGATAQCTDCYGVSVSDPATRPVTHWDAAAVESILPDIQGQQKQWLLHVGRSFTDVPASNGFYRFIETLLHHNVTSGCGATTFCPASTTTREQLAVFVLVGKEGAGYVPPACGATPVFADVPPSSPFCRWIEELARRGVVSGCGAGHYCPTAEVTREQMTVFVLRVLDPALNPPPCVPPNLYLDVPETSPFCRWIEELTVRNVVGGCGNQLFCPTATLTREQMGVFITVTFGLTLYAV